MIPSAPGPQPVHPFTNPVTFGGEKVRSEWPALYQQRNAALAAQARSLRASQEAVIRGVMPLGKGRAIPREACGYNFLAR
jgi:hypothetical protein